MQDNVRQWDWTNPPRFLQMSVVHTFLLFYYLHLFFTSQSPEYPTGNNITLQSKPKSGQLHRQHLFIVLFCTFLYRITWPTTSASSSTVNPSPGYHTSTLTMLQRELKSGQVRRQIFCLLYFAPRVQPLTPAIHARSSTPPIPYCVHKFSIFG